jgi:hypothetical protein
MEPFPGPDASTEDLVRYYFNRSFTIQDICGFLVCVHHMVVSHTTVKRILKRLKLNRNGVESPLEEIVTSIINLHALGYNDLGHKALWKHLNTRCGLRATQETVRIALQIIDPIGVELRRRNRLRRRRYINKGPHFLLHIDGYDKLKPFGIAIHGAIDGFSRRILWLRAGSTNNNPHVVARHYVDYLKEAKCVPRMVRSDGGSENVVIRDIQIALRSFHHDDMSGERSFSVGISTANQRIEMVWSCLKRSFTQFWRNIFKDLLDSNTFNNADNLHIQCVRYCFLPVIQSQLDSFRDTWNIHRIRSQPDRDVPTDVPDILFYQPLAFGVSDCSYKLPCSDAVLDDIARQYTDQLHECGCTPDFIQLMEIITDQHIDAIELPVTPTDAIQLFKELISLFDRFG